MKKSKIRSAVFALAGLAMVASFMSCNKKGSAKTEETDNVIHVFGASRGEEAARLEEIIKAFNAKTGFNVIYEGSPEFETQIQVQAQAGTPPDIAMIPQPGMMQNFAELGYLKPLP